MKLAIGCDPNATALKKELIKVIKELKHEYKDFGSDDPIYANVAIDVAKAVAKGTFDRGILLCGTGIGVSISANKVKGAYAALAADTYSAQKAVTSNNANVLCMGALTTGTAVAQSILRAYLTTVYVPGTPSAAKLACYVAYDKRRK